MEKSISPRDTTTVEGAGMPGGEEYAMRVSALTREVQKKGRVALNVAYGPDEYQNLDLYLPSNRNRTLAPILIYLHGGGWFRGDKEWMGFMAPIFTTLPAIFVSANYRLAPRTKFPGPMEDVADAVAWVYRNIETYGGDRNRIFLGGHSAGGHLAALVTLRKNLLDDRNVPRNAIKACLPTSAPYNLHVEEFQPGTRRYEFTMRFLARPEDGRQASPVDFADGNSTPFLVAFGSEDPPDLREQAANFIAALSNQPGKLEWFEIPGATHFATNEECRYPESHWAKTVRLWMSAC